MGKTIRKGSKMNEFKDTRDGRPTRCDRSCENNGGCPWCEKNRRKDYNKNKMSKQDLKRLLEDE